MADLSEKSPYQVLARKYRPQNFDDLIGHGAMVKTLKNAFATGRIAHAYVLTGVRGVGKTTTARILARALNYIGPNGEDAGATIDLSIEGRHCRAIAESRHPDVIEMDAASRTGVGDIRELIEGVRYAPVEARYKVYIIDEVHMLSSAAFNALLKTLEEPPPHVKFIFATTEIRKLPVTVLSRCQRFDLRRIEVEALTDHLLAIMEKEGASVDRDGLYMIARAAEGSVRDALSILDQALVQRGGSGEPVSAEMIRAMLGLADRSQTWDLLEATLKGDAKEALGLFRTQYDAGADPAVILRDLLQIVHLLTRVKAAGPDAASHGAAGEADAARAGKLAGDLAMNALTRAWSLLMKGLSETQGAPDPVAAGEIALIRLAYAADLPTPDEALKMLADGRAVEAGRAPRAPSRSSGGGAGAQAAYCEPETSLRPLLGAPAQAGPRLESLLDVVRLADLKRDAKLKVELESYVHLISFEQGRIELRLNDRAPADLPNRLMQRLKDWTGRQWIVSVNAQGAGRETLRDARTLEVLAHPLVKKAMEVFPGAEIVAIRDPRAQESEHAAIDPLAEEDESDEE
ncbi:MAG: DNA polymerase III subunit gamma/tau [Parvularculaceae bacterium]|nr:DNA polymerase III subunit gamma/tau [Parvularculaceae bacterium]